MAGPASSISMAMIPSVPSALPSRVHQAISALIALTAAWARFKSCLAWAMRSAFDASSRDCLAKPILARLGLGIERIDVLDAVFGGLEITLPEHLRQVVELLAQAFALLRCRVIEGPQIRRLRLGQGIEPGLQ